MPIPKLPRTVARLSTSVTIRLIPEDTLDATILNNPASALTAIASSQIGAVESFTETNERPAGIRFEMNSSEPGVVKEAYPQQVNARTIALNRVVLYTGDATETFQIDAGDIVQQSKPFALIKVESSPEGVAVPDRISIFRGCWFTSNPKAFNVSGGELKIIQAMNITYSEREVVQVSPS